MDYSLRALHCSYLGRGEQLEEGGCQREIVLGVLARQFANDVDGRALHRRVLVLQLVAQTLEGRTQRIGVVQEELVSAGSSCGESVVEKGEGVSD